VRLPGFGCDLGSVDLVIPVDEPEGAMCEGPDPVVWLHAVVGCLVLADQYRAGLGVLDDCATVEAEFERQPSDHAEVGAGQLHKERVTDVRIAAEAGGLAIVAPFDPCDSLLVEHAVEEPASRRHGPPTSAS